jgi:hypothetical protein
MRTTFILAAVAALAFAGAVEAKACKDSHGKFITCPSQVAAQKGANAMAGAEAKAGKAEAAASRKAAKAKRSAEATASHAMTGAAATAAGANAGAAKQDAGIAKGAARRARSDEAKAARATGERHCNKGKPCGNSCIPLDRVCHK